MNKIEMHAVTDIGLKREHNEDCVMILPERGIAVLADGMGGHNAGEVASSIAVDIISQCLKDCVIRPPDTETDAAAGTTKESVSLRSAVVTGNKTIYATSRQRPEYAGMGTTVVAAIFSGNRLTVAHVGDSRMYLLHGDALTRVTEDHSLVQEQVRRGLLSSDDARHSVVKSVVTRALGVAPDVEPDIVEGVTRSGDLYMMCSDGLTDAVPDEAIRLTLVRYSGDLEYAASKLIRLANDAGGSDNVSVILVRVSSL